MGCFNEDRLNEFLSYNSVKFVSVKNWRIALLNYSLITAILVYVVIIQIIINKGYQSYDTLVGSTSLKVKGTGATGVLGHPNFTVYDSYNLIRPALEPDALFIATSVVHTPNQTRGVCLGNDRSAELCANGCAAGEFTYNGVKTGACGGQFCMLHAWCPVEDDSNPLTIANVGTWTTFIKQNVVFPKFNKELSNADDGLIPGVNLFSNEDFLRLSGYNFADVVQRGAIVLVNIRYDCDFNSGDDCLPKFAFERLDVSSASFSGGFNYRYTIDTVMPDGTEIRSLYKVAGIRLLFRVSGVGGKFSFFALTLSLGSGLALLGIARFICDMLITYILPIRTIIHQEKYNKVEVTKRRATVEMVEPRPSKIENPAGWNTDPTLSVGVHRAVNVMAMGSDVKLDVVSEDSDGEDTAVEDISEVKRNL